MDSQGGPSIRAKVFCEVVGDPFRANEDEDFCILRANLIKVLDKFGSLFEVTADFNDLLNVVIGRQIHRPDVNLNGIFQEVL